MNILAIDDHFLFRSGLRFTLEGLNDKVNFIEASCLDDAEQLIKENDIHVTLLDLMLPGVNWEDGISYVQSLIPPDAYLVVVSAEENPRIMKTIQDMGVLGYIPKSLSPSKFVLALRIILEGESYFPRECLDFKPIEPPEKHTGLSELTPKQMTALSLLVQGNTNKQIAAEMCISEATVKSYLSVVYKLLGVTNRTEAVYKCQQMGVQLG